LRARGFFIGAGLVALALAATAAPIGELGRTIGILCLLSVPLALSIAAFLDAANHPSWVWALAQRRRVVWMAAIAMGACMLPVGLVIASWYLLRVRPELRATARGRLRQK
jgi:hypothetical protein